MRAAASPIISIVTTSASASMWLLSKSCRVLRSLKRKASCVASSITCSRVRSSLYIGDPCPLPLQRDQQHRNVGGGDAADAGRLAHGGRAELGQLLLCFLAHADDGGIIQSLGQAALLDAAHAAYLGLLLL